MFRDQFATHEILVTLVQHWYECCVKVRDKIRKKVARNSHASEILALKSYVMQSVLKFLKRKKEYAGYTQQKLRWNILIYSTITLT